MRLLIPGIIDRRAARPIAAIKRSKATMGLPAFRQAAKR